MPNNTTTPISKPGIKTTEFWLAMLVPVIVPVLMVLVHKFGFPLTEDAITAIVTIVVGTPLTYILGRIFNKKKVADVEKAKAESVLNVAIPPGT